VEQQCIWSFLQIENDTHFRNKYISLNFYPIYLDFSLLACYIVLLLLLLLLSINLLSEKERKYSSVVLVAIAVCVSIIHMENTLKPLRDGESVLDCLSPRSRSTVAGGVEDVYGEDRATEDQLVTPWTFSVARYCTAGSLCSLSVLFIVLACLCLSLTF
jgi:hypothetical protein